MCYKIYDCMAVLFGLGSPLRIGKIITTTQSPLFKKINEELGVYYESSRSIRIRSTQFAYDQEAYIIHNYGLL